MQQKIGEQRSREIDVAKSSIDSLETKLRGMAEFSRLTPSQQTQVISACENARQGLSEQKRIAMIRDQVRRFEDEVYPDLVSKVDLWLRPAESGTKVAAPDSAGSTTSTNSQRSPQARIVLSRTIAVPFDKALITDESDLRRYLDAVREAWLREIQAGRRVQI